MTTFRSPVREQDAASGELIDRLAGRQPGREAGHRRHGGMPGRAQGGARAHRVPDQDDRNRPDPAADIVQQIAEVLHRGGLRAIPAADPEPGPTHQDAVAAQRLPDRDGHRDHPQHSRLNHAGGSGAHVLAAVGNHDHAPD